MSNAKTRTIKVDALARVEGEGALDLRIRDGVVTELKFRIYEPPRFFEAFLRGRMYSEAPDITARICGICPIAYMLGASQAMEQALGVAVTGTLRDLRRLIYCGEWIESHVLHAAMLHAPDFLGMQDAFELAKVHPEVVNSALELKKLGNHILEVVGGRAIHPVNLKVGGFYRAPATAKVRALIAPLRRGITQGAELGRLFGSFSFPDYEDDYTFVCLKHPDEYAIHEGRVVSNRRLDIPIDDYLVHFQEDHIRHSTALHGTTRKGEPYMVGPLARYAMNYEQLTPIARALASELGLGPVVRNPFKSILVRMVETVLACEEALRLAESYTEPAAGAVAITPRAGVGHGLTEAPRGICYHRYRLDDEGRILDARIMPPTSQNQPQIEADLRGVVQANLNLSNDELQWRCEQTIRNYDPCISCSTHFLKLNVVRE
ncbi:MAG: Ni/Fe hydrogenase subunit alpha [Rhodospirillales bacterium]|jgi:coenzyme F420-reducing hydrogenase alpha subunit|nr:Ni/Fe hydrogenase subunit alpha [Rhodospirillales bacterium]